MPVVRRRAKAKRARYSRRHVLQLLTGRDDFGGAAFGQQHRSACNWAAMREAWECLGGDILAAWVPVAPGTRPYAWWAFDAREPRRRVDGGLHPFDNPERQAWLAKHPCPLDDPNEHRHGAYALRFGLPSQLCRPDAEPMAFESQAAYLDRLGLLYSCEREALDLPAAAGMNVPRPAKQHDVTDLVDAGVDLQGLVESEAQRFAVETDSRDEAEQASV